MNNLFSISAKLLSKVSQAFNLGHGSTWPGHIALSLNPHIVSGLLNNSQTQVILIAGTNGKTTTAKILTTLLEEDGKKVIQNTSGANLLNGIASILLLHTNLSGKLSADYAVFEVDENNLPIVLGHITPTSIIALDLFRDQLDRYGELDSIAKKWNAAFQNLTDKTTLILNADDPLIAYLAKDVKTKVQYFGLSDKEKGQKVLEHAADSVYCPNCGSKLTYKKIFYSHLGIWECPNCHIKRPLPNVSEVTSPLPGTYNEYNTLAAVLTAKNLEVKQSTIDAALQKVTPAFGRQEQLVYKEKNVQIFLSKNPISMNESLRTVMELSTRDSERSEESQSKNKPSILFVLNDRIPDGRDVSWIWDIDLESFADKFSRITVSGDRPYDMGLRLQYASKEFQISNLKFKIEEDLRKAIDIAIEAISPEKTLYILPTYSAMLEVRKILTGKKIL